MLFVIETNYMRTAYMYTKHTTQLDNPWPMSAFRGTPELSYGRTVKFMQANDGNNGNRNSWTRNLRPYIQHKHVVHVQGAGRSCDGRIKGFRQTTCIVNMVRRFKISRWASTHKKRHPVLIAHKCVCVRTCVCVRACRTTLACLRGS